MRSLLHAETLDAQAARGYDDQARCRLRLGHDRNGAERGHRGVPPRLPMPCAELASLKARLPANRLPAGALTAAARGIAPDLLLDLFRNSSASGSCRGLLDQTADLAAGWPLERSSSS